MKIEVRRRTQTSRSTIGELWVDGQKECFTLEPTLTDPVNAGHPRVTASGPFVVEFTFSPHLGYVTPELLNVPSRTDIRIHIGNKPEDTLGCVLVGESAFNLSDWISNSTPAFDRLMVLLRNSSEPITCTFLDQFQTQ